MNTHTKKKLFAAITSIVGGPAVMAGPVLTTLVNFNGTNGANPQAALIIDASDNLYGTTYSGGSNNSGTAFKVISGTGLLSTLASFTGAGDAGRYPDADLLADSLGNLYGTTYRGGSFGYGTVFKITAGSDTLSTLHSFNQSDGASPIAGLIADSSGNMYGTTYQGGSANLGTVFKIAPVTGTLSTMAMFNGSNGSRPTCDLIVDASGNLWGTTQSGGQKFDGTVFKVLTTTSAFSSVATFNGTNGAMASAGLVADSSGSVFGTTAEGGTNGDGTVFKLAAGNNTVSALANFNGTANGAYSLSSLIADASGNLYGTTANGGSSGDGTIFRVAAGTDLLTPLYYFSGKDGVHPEAGLAVDESGNLYGTTQVGGSSNDGTVFELGGTGFVTAAVNVSSGQTVHFNANSATGIFIRGVAGLNISAGGIVVVDSAGNVANRQLLVISGTGLSLAGSNGTWKAKLDLGDNDMDLASANLATITNQAAQGYAGGSWNGLGGLTSANAAADSYHLTVLGAIQNNQSGVALFTSTNLFDGTVPAVDDVLVKFTYYGDANLDGKVDGSDYSRLDAAFTVDRANPNAATGWFNGDFNYDGAVNGSDYTLIDNVFNRQGAVLTSIVAKVTTEVEANNSAAIPEPGGMSVMIATVILLGRTARQRSTGINRISTLFCSRI